MSEQTIEALQKENDRLWDLVIMRVDQEDLGIINDLVQNEIALEQESNK